MRVKSSSLDCQYRELVILGILPPFISKTKSTLRMMNTDSVVSRYKAVISRVSQVQQRFELLKKRKDTGGFSVQGNI